MFRLHDAERLALRHGVHHYHQLVTYRYRALKQELEEIFQQDVEDELVNATKASSLPQFSVKVVG